MAKEKESKEQTENESKSKVSTFKDRVKSKLTRRRVIVLVIIALVIGFFVFRSARKPEYEVETVKVEKGNLTESITTAGEISAEKYANMAFPASGKLSWLGITEGQQVNKWQALASLDKTTLWATYNQAQNNLRSAEASLDSTYDSVQGHDDNETYAQRATRTTAEVAKDNAYDALQAARYNLNNSTLYAPFSGVVTNFPTGLSEGINVTALTPIMSIIDPTTIYITSEVGEVEVVKLKIGQKALIEMDAYPSEEYEGRIEAIDFVSTITSTGGIAYEVKVVLLEEENPGFRVGMSGDVEFIVSENENILIVPVTSVTEEDDKQYVWIVNDSGKAARVEVEIGVSSIDDIEITSGLEKGMFIILRPPKDIEEGVKITVTKSNGAEDVKGLRGIFNTQR